MTCWSKISSICSALVVIYNWLYKYKFIILGLLNHKTGNMEACLQQKLNIFSEPKIFVTYLYFCFILHVQLPKVQTAAGLLFSLKPEHGTRINLWIRHLLDHSHLHWSYESFPISLCFFPFTIKECSTFLIKEYTIKHVAQRQPSQRLSPFCFHKKLTNFLPTFSKVHEFWYLGSAEMFWVDPGWQLSPHPVTHSLPPAGWETVL